MKLKEVHLENFGPIKTGRITQNKITVFFGPNNSGKSLTSRLIHGINSAPTLQQMKLTPFVKIRPALKKTNIHDLHLHAILYKSGLSSFNIVSEGARKCSIHVKYAKKSQDYTIHKKHMDKEYYMTRHLVQFSLQRSNDAYDSVYIPAGRTGAFQFFASIVQIRNRLLRDLLHTFGHDRATMPSKITTKDIKEFTGSADSMPDYIEQLHSIILKSQIDGLDRNIQKTFSDLFLGSVEHLKSPNGLHSLAYKDPTGFVTDIESAGSGTIAAFPIIAGMHYVKPKGTLIVEEPEVHLEPSRQLQLLDVLQDVAYRKDVNLVFTTHSDYIVKKILSMVSTAKIKNSDLNLYYFNRPSGDGATAVERIEVSKDGDAEQPLFDEAIDSLIGAFSN